MKKQDEEMKKFSETFEANMQQEFRDKEKLVKKKKKAGTKIATAAVVGGTVGLSGAVTGTAAVLIQSEVLFVAGLTGVAAGGIVLSASVGVGSLYGLYCGASWIVKKAKK